MKTHSTILTSLLACLCVLVIASPAESYGKQSSVPTILVKGGGNQRDGKSFSQADDDANDEYAHVASVADPIQSVNRVIFSVNHQLYRFIIRPISKTYDTVIPQPVRTGIFNVFDNLEYPDRVVNDLLQWKLKRAGYESEKFGVNSTVGLAGIVKVSDHIPYLADLPRPDTGQTFAKWGIGHGFYIVLPVLGPKSLRDTFGLAGDTALSPVFWVSIFSPAAVWIPAVTIPNSGRTLHDRLNAYDAATKNSVDPYLSARSAYIQNRNQAAKGN
jgi:phospholipid-binding lipoprotein MlaA